VIALPLARAAGLLLGVAADAVLGDPRRGHPVAGFGAVAVALERRGYADRRSAGVAHVVVLVGGAVLLGAAAERVGRGAVARTAVTAAATWAVLGGTSLAREGAALAGELDRGDLAAARVRLPGLCGRDPALLDAAGLARAGTESMAENTSDAVVAPLLWGAVAGVPGLLGYRAVNTLDAMVGHRSERYERFGWAAARLDDVANLLPARVCALLTAAVAPAVGGSPGAALRAWWRDAAAHPSPNAGPVEAAAAGALGVTLGGRTVYAHGAEERPRLGEGPPPGPADLRRAARLSRLVGVASAVLAAAAALKSGRRRRDVCQESHVAVI
jgi:adenosylcobinamide-phosphate synthase